MGCDIHLVMEERDPDFGWVGIETFRGFYDGTDWRGHPAQSRNYRLFAALAGVRGDGPEPRGIPETASAATRMMLKQWGADAHSASWLPLMDAVREFNARRYEEGEKAVDPKSYRDSFPASFWFGVDEDNLENYRLVFWFDN